MRTRGKHPVRVVSALCVALAATTPLAAQGGSAEDVNRQMAGALEVFTANGMRQAATPFRGSLADGAQASHRVQLTAGVQYVLFGVCDKDCTDFDLQLSDAGGNAVASDVEPDDTPMVRITPTRTGMYTVQGVMASCGQEPCYYGIGVYGNASAIAAAPRPAAPNPAGRAPAAGRGQTGGVQPGVYACTETVSIYTGTTYTSGGSYPNYSSSLQTRGSITITGANTYRMGTTSGAFDFDAASGDIRWRSGALVMPQVRGGRYVPDPQTRVPVLVVVTTSGQWNCSRG
jgi:hypothetical protein